MYKGWETKVAENQPWLKNFNLNIISTSDTSINGGRGGGKTGHMIVFVGPGVGHLNL